MSKPESTFQDLAQLESESYNYYVWKDENVVFVGMNFVDISMPIADFNDFVDGLKKFKKYNRDEFNFDSENFSFVAYSCVIEPEVSHVDIDIQCGLIGLKVAIPTEEFLDFLGLFSEAQRKLKELEKN